MELLQRHVLLYRIVNAAVSWANDLHPVKDLTSRPRNVGPGGGKGARMYQDVGNTRMQCHRVGFEHLLYVGANTVSRRENGHMWSNAAVVALLRLLQVRPENAPWLVQWQGVRLPSAA